MRCLTPLWPQWVAAFEVFLLALLYGISIGWITPFMGKLSGSNPPFNVTKEETTWVVSLISINRPIGNIIGTFTSSMFGIKGSAYLCGLSFLIGSVCLTFADSIKIVFGYFICSGIGLGIFECTNPVFIGEIADPKIRGGLVSFVLQGLMVGSLFGNITGAYWELQSFARMNMVIILFFFGTFYFVPHTPQYLIRRGKNKEAAKSVQWYNRDADARKEFDSLSKFLTANPPLSFSETLSKINTPVNRNTVMMIIGLVIFEKVTGIMPIKLYMEIMFTKAGITLTSPKMMVIIMTIMSIGACWISMYVCSKVERTTTMFVSCTTLSLAYCCWGLDYHLLDSGYSDPNLQWLVIFAAIIYRLCVCIGMIPMIHILMSELLAPDIKYMAIGIVNGFCSISGFFSSKYFQFMVDHLTYKYVFYIFAGFTALMGIYCKYFIPETKGKSLQEIQSMLNKKENTEEQEKFPV